ncbi:carbon-nitrogen hydrolase family protein [Candidatus Solincola tengchongensis]|uniref:carbon-nitrogen hydrolase family protein n=1 Tax=Candidatus Solincola tengchongensis TaxID=2900693 RepID=UPI00257A70F0|nr:carbon-nitrogen hydrolase family protein [Candidatus Solincola tengchongensis]
MEEGVRTLRVGAVQMESANGDIEGNLERATRFVEEAVECGARLVVLPEFMPTGYIFSKEIWDAAEPREGPTMRWLRETSRRLGVWLGTSYLEAEGEDFYNSFVITGPDGGEAGRVRKQTPAFAEAFFTRGEGGPHLIETALGRIGVGICYENQLAYLPCLMGSGRVDLLLMPHSAPSPMPNPLFPRRAVEEYNRRLRELAPHYARLLGIPAVMVNKCGPWVSPIPGLPFLTQRSSFPGFTCIADSDGTVLAQLEGDEGVVVEEVRLDPTRRKGEVPPPRGRWAFRVPWVMNQFRLIEAAGKTYYRLSHERRRRARRVSSTRVEETHAPERPVHPPRKRRNRGG